MVDTNKDVAKAKPAKAAKPAAAKPAAPKVEAAVLVDHGKFRHGQVVSGNHAVRGIAEGWADGHPDAVKAAKANKG